MLVLDSFRDLVFLALWS